MSKAILSILAALAFIPLAVGCSQNGNIVRGQGPSNGYVGSYDDCWECPVHGDNCPGPSKCRHCCKCCRPYHVPNDLSYPPPGDMPAVVQYPYYTCKGPDCFFHQ